MERMDSGCHTHVILQLVKQESFALTLRRGCELTQTVRPDIFPSQEYHGAIKQPLKFIRILVIIVVSRTSPTHRCLTRRITRCFGENKYTQWAGEKKRMPYQLTVENHFLIVLIRQKVTARSSPFTVRWHSHQSLISTGSRNKQILLILSPIPGVMTWAPPRPNDLYKPKVRPCLESHWIKTKRRRLLILQVLYWSELKARPWKKMNGGITDPKTWGSIQPLLGALRTGSFGTEGFGWELQPFSSLPNGHPSNNCPPLSTFYTP